MLTVSSTIRQSHFNLQDKEQTHDYLSESQTHSEILCPGPSVVMPGADVRRCGNEGFRFSAEHKQGHAALLLGL
jgi:hypothetical protein